MRIAIVNDSMMALEILSRAVRGKSGYTIAWTARDGAQAVELCLQDRPDLILMDVVMPIMDGTEATRQIMARCPCPILIVTGAMQMTSPKVFAALGAGAWDAVNTPVSKDLQKSTQTLLAKIELVQKLAREQRNGEGGRGRARKQISPSSTWVAIGSSAGGPAALAQILSALPQGFPCPIIVVQHIDEQFTSGLVSWLQLHCKLPVALAKEREAPRPGHVLVAAKDDHLVALPGGKLGYTPDPVEEPYRPSVDVFFQSLLLHYRGTVLGVLLTGMGSDGAKGLKALKDAGHVTIAQDQATSAVYGMPKAAAALKAALETLPLQKIGPRILELITATEKA